MWRRRRPRSQRWRLLSKRGVSKFQRRVSGGRDGCNLRADSERGGGGKLGRRSGPSAPPKTQNPKTQIISPNDASLLFL